MKPGEKLKKARQARRAGAKRQRQGAARSAALASRGTPVMHGFLKCQCLPGHQHLATSRRRAAISAGHRLHARY